ncbi:protein MCM10 homolog [Harmonia axyridis]|uniref:protein MCM10 homolog n=1 Tax=Harmonia axyridis TaxID=115357 RepID=UPI001E27607A|nr:protein MCM10 homolog [Harmonia axyridis]
MAHEDDLLACLLDVAEAELNSLNKKENSNDQSSTQNNTFQNKSGRSLQDIDLFSYNTQDELDSNTRSAEENRSLIHEGFTDSSDDEANKNYENKKYSESGQSIKNLLAHSKSFHSASKHDVMTKKATQTTSWKKNGIAGQLPTTTKKVAAGVGGSSNVVASDTMFGIRVINPVISSKNLEDKMIGRKVVPIHNINNYLRTLGPNEDWVIAGVVCNKGTTRTSAKGHQFMIWTISDLLGDIKTVALFLFGSAYEQFWKTQVGSVVGILNPSILDKREGSRDEAALSVDNAQKLLVLGQSKDLGTCKSTKKNGDKCTAIVNKSDCECCVYHIKKEYQNCSRRSELQSNFSGKGLIALRNKVLGKNEVFYAGKSYTAIPAKQSRKMIKKDKDRLQSLNGIVATSTTKKPTSKKAATSFDVDRGQRLKDMETLQKLGVSVEKFGNSRVNSNTPVNHSSEVTLNEAKANAVKILSKVQKKAEEKTLTKSNAKSSNTENKEFKKNPEIDDQYDRLQKSLDEIVQTNFIDLDLNFKELNTKTSSSNSMVENCKITEKLNNRQTSKAVAPSNSSTSVKKNSISGNGVNQVHPSISSSGSASSSSITEPVFSKALLSSTFPSLSNNGGVVDLSKPLPKRMHKAKLNALSFIRKNGPLEKSNPNNVKGKGLKRDLDELNLEGNPKKLQKIQENEFISDRFKKMMELQSKHMDLVELRDNEEKEKYFKKQEIKERMEEKMANTYKVECKAVRCLDCKYTNFSAGDKCKAEKHRLVYKNATKRFFKCGNCGNRVACLDIIPLNACKNCGDARWEKTTMMKEKNITNTVALSIRGGEQAFINSVVTDANINLLVPDES